MISFLTLLVMAISEPVLPAGLMPDNLRAAADTGKPKVAPRPSDQRKAKPSQPKGPAAQRGKPAPKPTGDPRLKRRKPPQLHSPRVP
jgi:hypothetical protein